MDSLTIKITAPYEKQLEFFEADTRFVAYGGARGGGKSWAARVKAALLAAEYDGIQILFLRRHLHELRENHIYPMLKLTKGVAKYKASEREFVFVNSSRIVMGYMANEVDALQYQGQSYDVIFMEEATQFSEFQFQVLTECNRSSGMILNKTFYPRMYFTCNPGGVGHQWVKRLFIDRIYKNSEEEKDYTFVRSGVYDNPFILKNSPDYVKNLENLPENRRAAMLYGNWDVHEGQYFSEFDRDLHVCFPFEIPKDFKRYVSIDYGLDMFCALWIATDSRGRAYVYRELYEKNLIISQAAELIKKYGEGEQINMYFAPPDLFSRRQETGRSAVDIFQRYGINFYKTNNNRVNGWYELKEWLKPVEDISGQRSARLMIFKNCKNLIRTLPALTFDNKNPNDVSISPHELTHAPDALRGFVMSAAAKPERKRKSKHSFAGNEYRGFLEYGV